MEDPMISTGALQARLGAADLRILDASWFLDGRDARAGFRAAHIPGAVFFDLDAISDRSSPLPHMLPKPFDFSAAVGALGVGDQDDIVVYDQAGLFSAARVWWTFRVMGAERVRVLDGGLPKWLAEARPTESGETERPRAVFACRPRPHLVADLDTMRAMVADPDRQVADARPAARFRGEAVEPRPGLRSGHMPGACNLPFGAVLDPDGTLKSVEGLRAAFAEAGIDPDRPVTTTCGSGVTAAILSLALARLGRDAPVYDGAWAEWGARADTEVAVGA